MIEISDWVELVCVHVYMKRGYLRPDKGARNKIKVKRAEAAGPVTICLNET